MPGDWFYEDATKIKLTGDIGLGKLLHVLAYGTLAGSAGWLPTSFRNRCMIAVGLIGHGALTEFIQLFVPYREGCVRDVIIDAVSISLGLAVTWRWWPRAGNGGG